jgi:hypothetical protein
MKWPFKLGIAAVAVVVLIVLAYVVMFPVHNWRLRHRIWVAFGIRAADLSTEWSEAAPKSGYHAFVPALQEAANQRFPRGTFASDVSNSLARVFGPKSVHIYERAPGDRRLSCGFDSEQGWLYRDTMSVEFSLDSSNRVTAVTAGYRGITP